MAPSPTKYFPLRWESTGDQWWYASPIDWAAANGHYDLVRELLRIDGNHLIKLTSLRRIRRLETVWDDHQSFHGAAKCRSSVARRLFLHCEAAASGGGKANRNSLIRAGYGGWLIYTAASAGDLAFVRELLDRNPLLVFGEGEYGVTDVLYAAARGKNRDVFRLLLDSATAPEILKSSAAEAEDDSRGGGCVYRWEMMNRAVHAAARGGNLTVLKELLSNCSDVLAYRDAHASTILHTAAGRGQVEIVKYLIETFDVITASTDRHGNTALHVAAFRGQLAASEAMISASPQLIYLRNSAGETFLHRAVSGFQSLQFRPLDRHVALLRRLVGVRAVVNARNSDGLTALHAAVIGNVHSDLVQILMSSDGIDLNAQDSDGLTALDHLRLRPRSASSDVLIRRLLSAGAVFSGETLVSRLKMMQGNGVSSPGSSFRISDAEIFLHAGIENNDNNRSTVSPPSLDLSPRFSDDRRRSSFAKPMNALKQVIMNWPKKKKHEKSSMESLSEILDPPTPLRKRFSSKPSSPVPGDKRSLAVRSNQSSPLNKKVKKKKRNSSFSSSPPRSSSEIVKRTGDVAGPSCSGNNSRRVKSQYYMCFGNAGVSVKGSPVKRTVSLVA